MDIEKIFRFEPDLGAETREPNLWTIVFKYFYEYFDGPEAIALTNRFMDAIKAEVDKQL